MSGDVFRWPMSAVMHKQAVDTLREEIIEAHQADPQRPVPIALIFALLPLETDQVEEAINRKDFILNGDNFENRVDDPLVIEFFDPVLKNFEATIPAVLSGTLEINPPRLKIMLATPIELEMPRLAEIGVDRSKFQEFIAIEVTPEISISFLREATGERRETWIEAQLVRGAVPATNLFGTILSLSVSASSEEDPCNSEDEPVWNVYERRDHLCIVHKGRVAIGGQLAYVHRFGPATRPDCEEWVNRNCTPTCG